MESEELAAALDDAEASRSALAQGIRTPSWFFTSMAVAVAVQIGSAAVGLGVDALGVLAAGVVLFGVVVGVQLWRFRRDNGAWIGGFASRVVLGSSTAATLSYMVSLGAAMWAGYGGHWWLVALWSLAGGAAYALAGRHWLRGYRSEPAAHSRGEPAALLALIVIVAVGGLALLVVNA